MAKLYWTDEVEEIIDNKITHDLRKLLDSNACEEVVSRFVRELRIFKKYAEELIEDMREEERKEDEERAAREAKRLAEKEEQDGESST